MNDRRATLPAAHVLVLLGATAATLAPHALRLPPWVPIVAAIALAVRGMFAWRGMGLPRTWVLALLAGASAAGIAWSYGRLWGRDAAVALLLLMACLKLLELRARRDALVSVFLAYFVVVTGFLYSQSVAVGLWLLACVWAITACLIAFQRLEAPLELGPLARRSGTLLAQALPLMLVFFVLFPRVNGPLWGLPQAQPGAVSGLSDSMSPGSLSNLSLSDQVAFRVDFDAAEVPSPKQLYWRGPVMTEFDGRTWRTGDAMVQAAGVPEAIGAPVRYSVTLEPHEQRWLFALDMPAERLAGALLTRDWQTLALRPVRARMRYTIASHLAYRAGVDEAPALLERALRLPPGDAAARARALGVQWGSDSRADASGGRGVVSRALRHFRDEPFFYTLAPPELGRDPVDEFLFGSRAGFCEHYAGAFVVLMRAAGVPARVVTGYQGGEVNPLGGWLIVRQSEAHAWAEVWLSGEGWVRVDPTAAVSPRRIERGLAAALPVGSPLPLFARTDSVWLRQLRFGLDAMANGWNQWVLGYNPDRQLQLFRKVAGPEASWRDLAIALFVATAIVVALLAAGLLRRLVVRERDPLVVAWSALSRRLEAIGLARRPHEGPHDYAARVAAAQPAIGAVVVAIARRYADARYVAADGTAMQDAAKAITAQVDALRLPARPSRPS